MEESRADSALLLSGDTSAKTELARQQRAVDAALASTETVDRRVGKDLGTTEELSAIHKGWTELKSRASSMNAEQSYEAHTKLLDEVLEHTKHVGDTSDLILNPYLDSIHLIIALIDQIPHAAEDLGELEAIGAGVAARRKMTIEEQLKLNELTGRVERDIERLERGLAVSFKTNPLLDRKLGSQLQATTSDVRAFNVFVVESLIKAGAITVSPKDYVSRAAKTAEDFGKLEDAITAAVREELVADEARIKREMYTELAIATAGLLVAFLLAYLIARRINGQITTITQMFGRIGMGNFEARAEVKTGDEIGEMAQNLNAMLDSTLSLIQSQEERQQVETSIQKLLEEVGGVADGNLTKDAEVGTDITGSIADSFNHMIHELRRIISRVQVTTLTVSNSAGEVRTTASHLAQGSEAQSVQIVEASAAVDEMAVSIQQVSANATTAATVAEEAKKTAKSGAQSVTQTIEGMNSIRQQVQQTSKRIKRLGERSQEIGEIVQLIVDLANRTSILALNASIQSVAAGDAGNTFGVVAEEVERLAASSIDASKKIGSLVKGIQADTNEAMAAMEETTREVVSGSSLANEAGKRLSEIETVSTRLDELISMIAMASKQQSRGSEAIAKSMGDISTVTQQTAAGAKQAVESIQKLAELADELRVSMSNFKLPKESGHLVGTEA